MSSGTGPIPIEPTLPKPALPGTVVVREKHELYDCVIADMLMQAIACIREFGSFHLALSGGSTPEPVYKQLMFDPACRHFPWKKTHIWIVDERCVPFDDEKSNFGMIRELIVNHSTIPADQVHPIHATESDAARKYEKELCSVLEWRERGHDRLDYVLLGMGDDGHTASLFPNSPALHSGDALVVSNNGPTVVPPPRITMTYRLLNASRFVSVLVVGERKREMIEQIQQHTRAHQKPIEILPVLGIQPVAGEFRWYLDPAACPAEDASGSSENT
ncbi:MAG: 6-phosphogluconolactonase [Phycisphaeraceae bacterium]|nr:6-phosphogluconolactonase [Phycisphaerales bacterium]MCB9861569.1 6-phosphogluconolactonase [Phycisphaeraceae bacterium]